MRDLSCCSNDMPAVWERSFHPPAFVHLKVRADSRTYLATLLFAKRQCQLFAVHRPTHSRDQRRLGWHMHTSRRAWSIRGPWQPWHKTLARPRPRRLYVAAQRLCGEKNKNATNPHVQTDLHQKTLERKTREFPGLPKGKVQLFTHLKKRRLNRFQRLCLVVQSKQ